MIFRSDPVGTTCSETVNVSIRMGMIAEAALTGLAGAMTTCSAMDFSAAAVPGV